MRARSAIVLGCLAVAVVAGCSEEDKSVATSAAPAPVPAPTAAASAHAEATAEPEPPPPPGVPAQDGSATPTPPKYGGGGEDDERPSNGDQGAGGTRGPKRLAAVAELSEGTLDRDEVQRAIDASAGKLTPCLQGETRVRVRATVTQTGDVADATILAAEPDEPKMRDCVAAAFRRVGFPRPKGGGTTTVTVDLVLRPDLKL
ncbi:MAG TPA: hypothetical protein VL400_24870 [Polyangiaceae bacterium]|jgi:hypothetical protein|nr:hypothetical protein [Polyangiaceae bacterium]